MPFPTTRSSVVLALSSEDDVERARAFETIAELYWRPLYKYARLAHSRAPLDAEDLTQSFLARILEKEAFATYDRERGSFRTFLRTLFDRHVANEIKAAQRMKRGGAAVVVELEEDHAPVSDPDELFRAEWARSVFEMAVDRLRGAIKPEDFALFEAYDLDDSGRPSYADLATRSGMNVTTVTNRLASARRRFRETVLAILRDATASDAEYRSEVRALLGVDA